MNEILLQTKLGIPSMRSTAITRSRLLEKVNTGLVDGSEFLRKLTLVSAPAGYGKTTLITEWLHGLGLPVAWLSLDAPDNDPNLFMAYLLAALQSIQPGFGISIQAMIQTPQPPASEVLLTIMLNELESLPALTVLVLDDYHVIHNLAIHKQISFLLEHLPHRIHLVLITREDPLISISRLRAGNQVLEIRQDDLRFTLEEISYFMRLVMQLDLSDADMIALERRTEGWVAGLQLVALSLHGLRDKDSFIQAFISSNRFILEYLIEEVFDRQSAEVQSFLLKTAILDRLTGCRVMLWQQEPEAVQCSRGWNNRTCSLYPWINPGPGTGIIICFLSCSSTSSIWLDSHQMSPHFTSAQAGGLRRRDTSTRRLDIYCQPTTGQWQLSSSVR
jgi:LuxR family maltose regulon positive regulatory protein